MRQSWMAISMLGAMACASSASTLRDADAAGTDGGRDDAASEPRVDAALATDSGPEIDAGRDIDSGSGHDAGPSPVPTELGPPERRAVVVAPDAYDGRTALPVLVMLHGLRGDGASQDAYFRMSEATRARGLYLVLPNGTVASDGARFWNATDACCDFDRTGVDDVGYLAGLVDELAAIAPVDLSRVYFVGHSNGGFMTYRMACERADLVTAMVSLAGADYVSSSACVPEEAVSVLHIHGTSDLLVSYDGGTIDGMGDYPGARTMLTRWATRGRCSPTDTEVMEPRDIDSFYSGAETEVRRAVDCPSSLDVELWTIPRGGHTPSLVSDFADQLLDWLLRHRR